MVKFHLYQAAERSYSFSHSNLLFMKNTPLILGLITVVAGGGIVFALTRNTTLLNRRNTVFCSPDGTLTDTQLIQSHRSYCVQSNAEDITIDPNKATKYSFSIIDDQGNTLKDFTITHTKLMHVIIVRKDLAYFQHVHPEFNSTTGEFTLNDITFPASGEYRIFADFATTGTQIDHTNHGADPLTITIADDVLVSGEYNPQATGSEEIRKAFEGNEVTLTTDKPSVSGQETKLSFALKQDGKPVSDLEEYLGALGHSVILRESSLDFIHAHPVANANQPQDGVVDFMMQFPKAGKYKIFTQFQRNGKIITTDFVISVAQGSATPDEPFMDHSTH